MLPWDSCDICLGLCIIILCHALGHFVSKSWSPEYFRIGKNILETRTLMIRKTNQLPQGHQVEI